MTHLPLSCPQCHKALVYVPLDGFTLHYRCSEHGAFILRPLVVVESDDVAPAAAQSHPPLATSDVA